MHPERLAQMQKDVRIGGKGSARRKKKIIHKTAQTDDKKLQGQLKKLYANNIPGIEEVNMIKDDGTVLHFVNPKVQAAPSSNMFSINGHGENKKLTEMLPSILNQLGSESINSLQKLVTPKSDEAHATIPEEVDEDDVPDLVENFDEASKDEAAADYLDDLLDELEKNEGEQTQPMQTSQSHVVKSKSAVTSDTNITKASQDQTSTQSTNHLSNTGMFDNDKAKVESVPSNEKVTCNQDSANLQTQSCEDLMAQSEEIIAHSMNIEDSAGKKTMDQPSPNTLMKIFGALPESPAKSEIDAPAMLFSPLNPFSASYTGPITTYEGENIFFEAKRVGDPFEIDGIETVDKNETITARSDASSATCEQMAIAPLNNFDNRNGVQSIDVPVVNHLESLSNLSDTHDSATSTDKFLQGSSITADHTEKLANAGIDLLPTVDDLSDGSTSLTPKTSDRYAEERSSVSKNLNTNVPYQPEGQVQSQVKFSLEPSPISMNLNANVPYLPERQVQSSQTQSSPNPVSMKLNPNVSYQPERQETNSTGFMRDVEISKEEFDRFWEEVEDDNSEQPGQIGEIKNDITTMVKPTLPHEPTLLDPTPNPSTSSNNLNTWIEPSSEESIISSTHGQPRGTATVVKSTDSTAHSMTVQNNLNIPPDVLVEVASVASNEPQDTGDIAMTSSETVTSPVSVPYTSDHASSRGSPTFPLQPKANPQTTQVPEECDRGHVGSEANRLSLDVSAHVEQNVDVQDCYPATPPPPYSEEMHVNYERSNSGPTSDQQQSAHLRRQEEVEDFSLLAIMESITRPGETKPIWIPDQDAPQCSNCAQKFTFTRRRHHCRACGRVFCANCCSERAQLKYLEFKEARVCLMCCLAIKQADAVAAQISQQRLQSRAINNAQVPQQEMVESAQPIEPADSTTSAEYVQYQAVTVPDQSQVEAPQGGNEVPSQEDLEVEGATAGAATVKTVRFSDGTRPTHPDETPTTPPPPPTRINRLRKRHGAAIDQTNFDSLTLPPAIIAHGEDGTFAVQNDPDSNVLMGLLESGNQNPQTFVLNPNLFVHVKFVSHANRQCWCYWSEGMDCVGQREIVLVLERQGLGDRQISSDAFMFYKHIFDRARKGKIFNTSDYMPKSVMGVEEGGEVFNLDRNAGFLFVQATSQPLEGFSCLKKKLYWHPEGSANSQCDQPINGMLFAILVQKTEAPLATLFPLRLMLRLGIETKQYPCPLFSIRQRDPVFQEIGHTILAILCDFNNFKYRIIGVSGMRVVLSSNGHVSVQIPCNRFRDTIRIMNSSNESVLAIGTGTYGPKLNGANSTTSTDAPCDSHLVCVQDNQTTSYHTEISSMKNVKPMNTGAAFVIFNGSLKSDGSHSAKCAIVEDGVMIQLLPEKMEELRSSLKSMEDFSVPLAANSQNIPDQDTSESNQMEQLFLEVKWVDDDKAFNIGMFSPIDGTPFEGVVGFNVQGRSEQKGKKFILRWNQVFFLASTGNPLDLSRLAEQVANGCFMAFTPVIQELVKHRLRKIGVRVTIHPENVGYIAGGGQKELPLACMNSLDEHLIQTIHNAANSVPVEQEAVVFELLFSVLLTKPSYRTA